MFIAVLFTIAKTWKPPKCPLTEERIKRMLYTQTDTRQCCSVMKKNEITPFAATWTDLGIIIPAEVSQKEKDKYHMISLTCVILKNGANGFIYKQKQTH